MSSTPIRVLLVHDSPTVRASLRRTIESDPSLHVALELPSAHGLVGQVRESAADVVVMDVVMPEIDGWDATRALMAERPTPIVLVSQVVDPRDRRVALEAIRAGALAIVDPPPPPDDAAQSFRRESFLALVRSAAQAHVRTSAPPSARITGPARARPRVRVIGVVASAGGPAALAEILERLPAGGFAPLLVVQHVAKGFAEGLARWLEGTGHPVSVALAGEPLRRGHVYVAPDDRHLGVTPGGASLRVSDAPPVGLFRPSGTWLLDSLARELGAAAAGVVLTGMGDDGAAGALELRRRGAEVIAQDEASSAVFGMPGAAVARGAVGEVLPPPDIAQWIVDKSGAS